MNEGQPSELPLQELDQLVASHALDLDWHLRVVRNLALGLLQERRHGRACCRRVPGSPARHARNEAGLLCRLLWRPLRLQRRRVAAGEGSGDIALIGRTRSWWPGRAR